VGALVCRQGWLCNTVQGVKDQHLFVRDTHCRHFKVKLRKILSSNSATVRQLNRSFAEPHKSTVVTFERKMLAEYTVASLIPELAGPSLSRGLECGSRAVLPSWLAMCRDLVVRRSVAGNLNRLARTNVDRLLKNKYSW
jgi:hypothetical protein